MPMSGTPLYLGSADELFIWDRPMRWGAPSRCSPACRSRAADCPEDWIASRAVAQVAQAFAGEPDVVEGDGAAVPGRRLGLEADRDGGRVIDREEADHPPPRPVQGRVIREGVIDAGDPQPYQASVDDERVGVVRHAAVDHGDDHGLTGG